MCERLFTVYRVRTIVFGLPCANEVSLHGPIVYRLGHLVFIQISRVRLSVGSQNYKIFIGGSSNSRTAVFGAAYRGANPCPPARLDTQPQYSKMKKQHKAPKIL